MRVPKPHSKKAKCARPGFKFDIAWHSIAAIFTTPIAASFLVPFAGANKLSVSTLLRHSFRDTGDAALAVKGLEMEPSALQCIQSCRKTRRRFEQSLGKRARGRSTELCP